MAKFNFRFQHILKIKEQMEEMRKNELSKSTVKYLKQKEIVLSIEDSITHALNLMREAGLDKITPKNLMAYNNYISRLKDHRKDELRKLNAFEFEMNQCRNNLIEAVKQKKIYESLMEKDFEQFKLNIQAEQDKLLDEVISYRFSK